MISKNFYAMHKTGSVEFGTYQDFFREGQQDFLYGRDCPYDCGDGKIAWEEGWLTKKYYTPISAEIKSLKERLGA
jgi:hypothetical protein